MKVLIASAQTKCQSLPATYLDLCGIYLPRPIHQASDLESATEMADDLAGHELNPEQQDYLEAVSTFIEQYERRTRQPRKIRNGLSFLKFLLDQNEMTAADLSRLLGGSRGLGAMILRGERKLTVGHVRRIAETFGVPADLLIGN